MARYYKCFMTKEDRKQWEDEQKQKDPTFKVCFHYPVKDLEKELYMPKGNLAPYRFATVYTWTD